MIVYFLSGLGADKRAFQKLSLPTNWTIKNIQWLNLSKEETLSTYCNKISKLIDTTQEFAIVGLSFGGLIATELAKTLNPQKIIIISSISTRQELPMIYKVIGLLKLHKVVPDFLLNRVYPFTYWFFGTQTHDEKALPKRIISDTPTTFLKWAINEILIWKNNQRPENICHIHGTNDRIFLCNKTLADVKINGGGHFMVYNKANIISKVLTENLGCS